MKQLSKEELISVLDSFINETGQWERFKAWIEKQGYKLEELGFPEE